MWSHRCEEAYHPDLIHIKFSCCHPPITIFLQYILYFYNSHIFIQRALFLIMLSFSHNSLDFLLPTRFSIFYYILVSITLYLLYRISTSPSTNPAATASYFLSFSAYFPSVRYFLIISQEISSIFSQPTPCCHSYRSSPVVNSS